MLFIRGERPIIDEKYDIFHHPNIRGTIDGKAEPYRHGSVTNTVATLVFDPDINPAELPELEAVETDYELLSEEDLEIRFLKEDNTREQNK